jgi:hypothetical protein
MLSYVVSAWFKPASVCFLFALVVLLKKIHKKLVSSFPTSFIDNSLTEFKLSSVLGVVGIS